MNWRKKNKRYFYNREAHIENEVLEKFISNDIAVIPCKVSGYDDIIHPFSVEGYESVNPSFISYVADIVSFIPSEYPIVLDITGCSFSEEQKKTIIHTMKTDAKYSLGAVENEGRDLRKKLLYMLSGLLIMGVFLTVMNYFISGMPKEFFYIVFWFFADFVISYVLWDRREHKKDLIRAGQIVSIEVMFQETFKPVEFSDEEKKRLYDRVFSKDE